MCLRTCSHKNLKIEDSKVKIIGQLLNKKSPQTKQDKLVLSTNNKNLETKPINK